MPVLLRQDIRRGCILCKAYVRLMRVEQAGHRPASLLVSTATPVTEGEQALVMTKGVSTRSAGGAEEVDL